MCFGSKLKGDAPPGFDNENLNSRPVNTIPQSKGSMKMPQNESYSPPAGPPPSQQHATYNDQYAPPPGPPPSHEYTPPSGPPPSQAQVPYHDWQTAVPDTSLLPPPPSMGYQRSDANNATEEEALQGKAWCEQNPLAPPVEFPQAALEALDAANIGVIKPRSYNGDLSRLRQGVWAGKTKSNSKDSCIISTLPLYSVYAHSPLRTEIGKTIYFEVKISNRYRGEITLGLGFVAQPYPTFRLPGWHRGALGVHGDDGHKYINDLWGGKDFTNKFQAGQTLGIGMTFTPRNVNNPPAYDSGPTQTTAQTPINVEIFFTRDGKKDGGWNLHEEGDSVEDLPVTGLEGMHDLYAAVGTFDNVEFEIVFNEREWMYRP
ncbi:hypothetical protein BHYA_0234g00030 [Botrytis hyacinthi]|uniref:SPRY domain-containing protein n=1 Tax=Botrytis hyacinthi TaxID=278943 RepID=A0A4Z1GDZ6_9HELO|nr:hypothetical protein BHYA_0234g00030 [Botrytis hyacinthi]